MEEAKNTGLTKSSGYQVGARRTFNKSLEETWSFLLSAQGLEIWLGTAHIDKWETGLDFGEENGVQGKVRVFRIYSHIRLGWKRAGWEQESVLQVRTIPKGFRTMVSFHQELLTDAHRRKEMKEHWTAVLDQIEKFIY